tara:strand:- start:892 stop:1164 length:273 start_codon:yes stop_codon:yes gene_type:complete
LNAFEMVKNTLNEIVVEEAAVYEAQLNDYRNWIDQNATEVQMESYAKALKFGWTLESADEEFIRLLNDQSTMKIYSNGRIRRTKPTVGDV